MKFLLKIVFVLAALALLVVLGMNNTDKVSLSLPPLMTVKPQVQAAYMYYGFFGVGFVAGALLMSGGGGKRSASAPAKGGK